MVFTVSVVIHPWRRLRALLHVDLIWHDPIPGAPMGETDFAAQTISLRADLNQAERRSTILHEILHIERGPVPLGLVDREECRVRKLAAQLLLPDVRAVADALTWSQWRLDVAADELWVDEPTLRDRLRFMSHPAERAYMVRRFEEVHDGVG